MLKKIDEILDKITMYKVTLYFLLLVTFWAFVSSFWGLVPFSPWEIFAASLVAFIASNLSNFFFARIFNATINTESASITSLILTLIFPIFFGVNLVFLALVCVIAMASKYVLVFKKQHIFNPAAIAILLTGVIFPTYTAVWWVASPVMAPVVIICGLLLVRRIKRREFVFVYLAVYVVLAVLAATVRSGLSETMPTIQNLALRSELWFFAFVMLTEPFTSPNTKKKQNIYSMIVAIVAVLPQFGLTSFIITPEVALCIGNIFAFAVSPHYRLTPKLLRKNKIARDTYELVFEKDKNFSYKSGQYMEWTLPHSKVDAKGNRRYFTIASSPTEETLILGIKVYEPASSFKKALLEDDAYNIIASKLSGEFVVPNYRKPMAFIAGGIGVTPFRSIIKNIIDTKTNTDIILLYSNKREADIVFKDIFAEAEKYGVKTRYFLSEEVPDSWPGGRGLITGDVIKSEIADYATRLFYISGPQLMVQSFEGMLRNLGLPRNQIRTDYFPGFSGR